MTLDKLKNILEAILLSADKPMDVTHLDAIFNGDEDRPSRDDIRKALHDLADEYADRGFELKHVSSGFRIQVKQDFSEWVGRLWEEKPARYTRALLETMSLIAYRQPITRGEIEEVRGVSVSSNIIRTLQEREWIKVLGHKDVPGKPALYGTSREFLDYFNLKSLDDLPSLAEIKDLDKIYPELALDDHHAAAPDAETGPESEETAEVVAEDNRNDEDTVDDVQAMAEDDELADTDASDVVDEMESEEAVLEDEDDAMEEVESEDTEEPDVDAEASSATGS
ncbi:SMC-Scp complex subunit ScpB [Pseudomonadota bacterium]